MRQNPLDRSRFRVIDFVTGSRAIKTGKKLWNKVKDIECNLYTSDHLPAYKSIIDKGNHKSSKAETTHIESSNANTRHYLARFRRKTRCYSKSQNMVDLSLYLLMYKHLFKSIF